MYDALDRLLGEGTWVTVVTSENQTVQVLFYSRQLTDAEQANLREYFMRYAPLSHMQFQPSPHHNYD